MVNRVFFIKKWMAERTFGLITNYCAEGNGVFVVELSEGMMSNDRVALFPNPSAEGFGC